MNELDFYLNSHLRKKELQVMVQPTSQFVVNDVVPISFNIYTKTKYVQDFMEEETIKEMISKENFEEIVSRYIEVCNDFLNRLEQENIVFVEGDGCNQDTFYVGENYITVESIVECCKKYAEMKDRNEFTVHLNKDLLLYKNGEFFNLNRIENNKDNKSMEEYIKEKVSNQIDCKDSVILFILEKWIQQEKKKYPKSKKKIEEYFVPSDEEGYFTFDNSEDEALTEKIKIDLELGNFLIDLYGQEKGKFIMGVYDENPYIRWKW